MGKLKQVAGDTEKKQKKTKQLKEKSQKSKLQNGNSSTSVESPEVDLNKLILKQQEACNVIDEKKNILVKNQLSYLEYIEMHEEITRLNEFRDNIQGQINVLRRNRKK